MSASDRHIDTRIHIPSRVHAQAPAHTHTHVDRDTDTHTENLRISFPLCFNTSSMKVSLLEAFSH